MKYRSVLVIVLLLASAAVGQSRSPPDKAVVYIYSYAAATTIGTVKKPIFIDGKEIASISPAKFFIALVEPGKHAFHLKNKKLGGVEREFEAGVVYYIRLDWRSGAVVSPAGFVSVPAENGAFDVKQLRPMDKKYIKDPSQAFVSLTE